MKSVYKVVIELILIVMILMQSACSSENTTVLSTHIPIRTSTFTNSPTRSHTSTNTITYTPTSTIKIKAVDLAIYLVKKVMKSGGRYYLLGGQGWDWKRNRFVDPKEIILGYYYKPFYTDASGTINSSFVFGKGLDCSGLILWAYNKASGATERFNGPITKEGPDGIFHQADMETINESDLLPGDLLYFDSEEPYGMKDHVAMYIGGNDETQNVVEAANPQLGIIFTSLENLKLQYGAKWIFYRRVNI